MFSKLLICIGILTIVIFSCKKNYEEFTGTIKDFTGIDGCGLVIVLDNGTTLEPGEFPSGTVLTPDKRIAITYQILDKKYSICMIGPIIKIRSLRYL